MCVHVRNNTFPLPINFNLATIKHALLHGPRSLGSAFYWGDTVQGHSFWAREQASEVLSNEARLILTAWVHAAEEGINDV